MHPSMLARLQSGQGCLFYAVELTYPTFTLRLVDAGFVVIDTQEYRSRIAGRGKLKRVDKLKDGAGGVAPRWRITLTPDGFAAEAALTEAAAQGSRVRAWEGTVDPETGLIDGEPDLRFIGEIDTATLSIGESRFDVVLECCTGLDLALEAFEGQFLNDDFHQTLFPGELGMDAVTGLDDPVYWGISAPLSVIAGGAGNGLIGRVIRTVGRL